MAAQVLGAEADKPDHNLHAVVHFLHANLFGQLPSQAEVDAWIETYGLHNTTLAATDAQAMLAALDRRECVYVVETAGMTIVHKACSCTNAACEPSIVTGLAELDARLNP